MCSFLIANDIGKAIANIANMFEGILSFVSAGSVQCKLTNVGYIYQETARKQNICKRLKIIRTCY